MFLLKTRAILAKQAPVEIAYGLYSISKELPARRFPGKVPWNDEEKARMRKLNARDVSIFQSFYFAANVPEMMAEC